MNFSEIVLFIVFFAVFYNIFELLRIRWAEKKQNGDEVSLVEKVSGLTVFVSASVTFVYPVYYSFIKYQDLYGMWMALVASAMVFVCMFILIQKAIAALKALFATESKK